MTSDNDDKLIASPSPDETTAEMDVIKDLFGQQQPEAATVEVFSQDLFSEPAPKPQPPAAKPAPAPSPPAGPASALGYQPKAEDDIKVVTDQDLVDLFASSSIGTKPGPAAPPEPPAEPESTPAPAAQPEPEETTPTPIAKHVEAEEFSLDHVEEISPIASEPQPSAEPVATEPAPIAEPVAAEEISLEPAVPEPAVEPEPEAVSIAEPVDAVEFRREQVEEELGEHHPTPEVDTGMKSAIVSEAVEIGEVAAEEPAHINPLEDISPDEIVADLENHCEVGEMTAVAAGKKGELLEKTAGLLKQLEPTGKDLLSVAELTKLYNNMNVLIEWARTMSERMDRLEAALAKLSPEDEE